MIYNLLYLGKRPRIDIFWYNRIDIWLQLIYLILYMHMVTKNHMEFYITYLSQEQR